MSWPKVVAAVLAALGLFGGGWALGHRQGPSATVVAACDAGVTATASLAFSFDAGSSQCFCDAGTTVSIKPKPPVIVYLPGDAGPCIETVEEDITVSSESASSSTTGPIAISIAVDAGASAAAEAVAKVTPEARCPVWGLGGGPFYNGALLPEVDGVIQPTCWLELQGRAIIGKGGGGGASVLIRW